MNKIDWIDDTSVSAEVTADEAELTKIKQHVLKEFQPSVSADGFRKGKVPLSKVEANVDDNQFKSAFLDHALQDLLQDLIKEHKLRPIGQPQVEIKKFAPYTTLEFTVKFEVVGKIKLADYKKLKAKPADVKVTKTDIDEVVASLQKRLADKKTSDKTAADGDEVIIDFSAVDEKGKEVSGATGKDYPIVIGSDTFIKGFEPELIGLKKDESKTFDITFPSDYGHKPLANKKVTFTVNVKEVKEVIEPKVDDEFAAKAGPFKTVNELREDIERQLTDQKKHDSDQVFKDNLLKELVESSDIPLPSQLLADQQTVQLDEFKQSLTYRGITISEYLEQAGTTEEEFVEAEIKPQAERKVKVGLALAEVAQEEGITVSPEEIEIRKQLIKGQSSDPQMAEQLESPEADRDIASRLLSEKTINKLVEYTKPVS